MAWQLDAVMHVGGGGKWEWVPENYFDLICAALVASERLLSDKEKQPTFKLMKVPEGRRWEGPLPATDGEKR